jgi:hypothetical protein
MTENRGLLDAEQLAEMLKDNAKVLGEKCGYPAVELLAKTLSAYIGDPESDEHSYIWRAAVEDNEQDQYRNDHRSVLMTALRDAVLAVSQANVEESTRALSLLLNSEYASLVRVGIYVCGERYSGLGQKFWEHLRPKWFYEVPYWHELYWFIKKSFSKFSLADRDRFLGVVNSLKVKWREGVDAAKWDEVHRRDILHAAFGQGDIEVDTSYRHLVDKYGPVRAHVDFHAFSTSGWRGENSPVTADELAGASPEKLTSLMEAFKPTDSDWDGPTFRGFSDALATAVRSSEDGFSGRMRIFGSMPRPFQHGLLRGLKERWSEDKRDLNWDSLLQLLFEIVNAHELAIDAATEGANWEPNVNWVLSDIADLAKAAVDRSDRVVTTDVKFALLEALSTILRKVAPDPDFNVSDAVSTVINSPRGRVMEAYIILGLSIHREEVRSVGSFQKVWTKVEPLLDRELGESEAGRNYEFPTIAGMYCANLHFLSPSWIEKNFDRILSLKNDKAWLCAAQGFSCQHHLHDWLYKRLIEGGHIFRMITDSALPDSVADRALQFVGLAYLHGLEALSETEGYLATMIEQVREKELSKIVRFFWMLRHSANRSQLAPRILEFWDRLGSVLGQHEPLPNLQSTLNLLAEYLTELPPRLEELWRQAAPYAPVEHHGYVLAQHLNRLSVIAPRSVSEVLMAVLVRFLPEYKQEDIAGCVWNIASAGYFDEAEQICIAYATKGSTLLKPTYEKVRELRRKKIQSKDLSE